MLFEPQRKDYVETGGPVRYLDGSSLTRPLDLPRQQFPIMIALVVAAVVIGSIMMYIILGSVQGDSAQSQASVEDNLTREVSYDLPVLSDLIQLDDDSIKQTFTDAGYTTYETSTTDDGSGFELIKLPSDVSLEEAATMYLQGIENLDASDASLLLNGSWTLTVERGDSLTMRVRYADFSSESLEAAVDAAITTEGFDASTASETDVDESGNTFRTGSIDIDGTTYTWQVSAIELSEIYDIADLPESALYVGIRITA